MLRVLRGVLMTLHFILVCCSGLVLCLLRPFHPATTRRISVWFGWSRFFNNIRLDVRGRPDESIQGIYVTNHQSTMDMFMYGESLPDHTAILGKHSLLYIPLFGVMFWLAGNIFVERGNKSKARDAMKSAADTVREKGCSVYIFPEGTRSNGKGLLPFKSGAFILAIEAGLPIIPMCASSTHKNIDLNRWSAGTCRIDQLAPVSTEGMTRADAKQLARDVEALMRAHIDQMDQELAGKA